MTIDQFKEGDLVTRIKRTKPIGDSSYCGSKLQFVGFERGIIFLISRETGFFNERIIRLSEACGWKDDGWDFYPNELHDKAIALLEKK